MSLNKTLDRLFDEIRREAKRNPAFADRLDAVLRLHESRRDVAEDILEEVGAEPPATAVVSPSNRQATNAKASDVDGGGTIEFAPPLNPAGLYKKEGEEALAAALAKHDIGSLQALVAEHNLDPGGVASELSRDDLAAHILAQAKRRAERDDKMFDY